MPFQVPIETVWSVADQWVASHATDATAPVRARPADFALEFAGGGVVTLTAGDAGVAVVGDDGALVARVEEHLARALFQWPSAPVTDLPALSAGETAVYFGTHKVRFARVPGSLFVAAPGVLAEDENTAESRAHAQARLFGEGALGEEYAHVYQPCLPCPDVVVRPAAGIDADAWAAEHVPASLREPLIKTADGPIEGLRSGGRSAILVDGRRYLRLKGCGNYVDGSYGGKNLRFPYPGLPVARMEKVNLLTFEEDPDAVEVRGCSFAHTSRRELVMCERVARVLAPLRIPCGLRAVGAWDYAIPEEPFPRLPKCCALFDTRGERRVAAHLLPGLESLLTLLFQSWAEGAEASGRVAPFFPEDRQGPFSTKVYDVGSDSMKPATYPVVPTTEVYVKQDKYPSGLLDLQHWLREHAGALVAAPLTADAVEPFLAATLAEEAAATADAAGAATGGGGGGGGGGGVGASETTSALLRAEWAAAVARLAETAPAAVPEASSLGEALTQVLAHLYWRVGRECGLVRRAMNEAGLSWGNYCDHILEPHNNSHPNNFVVVPSSTSTSSSSSSSVAALVAPVDFDMAYPRESYYLVATGELDPAEFEASLERETLEMGKNLSGNTSSTGLMDIGDGSSLPPPIQAVRWALRDTLVRGYDTATQGRVDPWTTTAAMDHANRALVTLALVAAHRNTS